MSDSNIELTKQYATGALKKASELLKKVHKEKGKEETPVSKDFGEMETPQGGIHVHRLVRTASTTLKDGAHNHLYVMPDGTFILTQWDGAHNHPLSNSAANAITGSRGRHTHQVVLPNGSLLETASTASGHSHELQIVDTTFGGAHVHTLTLDDGTELTSLLPGDFWAMHHQTPGAPLVMRREETLKIVKLSKKQAQNLPGNLEVIREAEGFSFEKDNPFTKRGEQRMVLGINLEPGVIDAQDDTYNEKEVRKAALNAKSTIGNMHEKVEQGAVLMGDYIAVKDFDIDKEKVKKGTWLSLINVFGDKPWSDIQAGDLGGLSIGGSAKKTPVG